MNQYIITEEIIAELIDYANAEDAEACIRNIIKTKVRSHPYNPQDLSNIDIGGMVKEINRRGMDCRIRDKKKEEE